jgi:hypothetical protein
MDSNALRQDWIAGACQDIVSAVERKVARREFQREAIENSSVFLGVGHVLIWNGEYQRAIDVLGKGLFILDSVSSESSPDPSRPVSRFPLRALAPSMALLRADAFQRSGRADSAHAVYARIVGAADRFTLGPGSLAAAANARLFLHEEDLPNAERYCAYAFQLNSPFADSVLTDIGAWHRSHGGTARTRSALVAAYQLASGNNERIPDFTLTTSRGLLHPSRMRDTVLYLFFVSEDCSVCRLYIPRIQEGLARAGGPHRAVIISPDPVDVMSRVYGAAAELGALKSEVALQASIASFPTVLVVRDGRIIFRGDGLSETSVKQLVGLAQ